MLQWVLQANILRQHMSVFIYHQRSRTRNSQENLMIASINWQNGFFLHGNGLAAALSQKFQHWEKMSLLREIFTTTSQQLMSNKHCIYHPCIIQSKMIKLNVFMGSTASKHDADSKNISHDMLRYAVSENTCDQVKRDSILQGYRLLHKGLRLRFCNYSYKKI